MTRVNQVFRMPGAFEKNMPEANRALVQQLNRISEQLNALSEGHLHAVHNAYTAAPTGGDWAQGDFIRKSDPVEAGSASSKYVIIGWICTVGGTPGTWLECRVLTGN